jgi:hypothetical protein
VIWQSKKRLHARSLYVPMLLTLSKKRVTKIAANYGAVISLEDAMMKVKVAEIGKGLHPSEVVVAVKTVDGDQSLVIDRRSLDNGFINIGYPIRVHNQNQTYLIELPRETSSGSWRVWVNRTQLEDEPERQLA